MLDMKLYVIALYIRLSIEDVKVESMSIDNQKLALHKYVDSMENACNAEVLEFIDNGYSGTNFERPAVQELIDAVRAGKVNCIIVKDFSRFGRNSIEVGYFMERVFPLYGVRFISVNDGYDSINYQGDTGGISVAFKYLAAEFYSCDLSVKSTTAKLVKMKQGEYQSVICPFGYKKSADGRMEPDEETAPTVRLIFTLAAHGSSAAQIGKALVKRGIPTPGEYKAARGIAHHDVSRSAGLWQTSTITRLLDDERYTGTYIIGKRHVTEIGSHHVRMRDESEWIKIPNHHPAIVSKELFEQAQSNRCHFKCPKKNTNQYPLRTKVFCGCCRHALSRSNNMARYYYCRHSRVSENAPCRSMKVNEIELETALYAILSKQAQVVLNLDNLDNAGLLDVRLAEQADCAQRMESYKAQKRTLYERFILREIDKTEYMECKAEIDKELSRLEQACSALNTQTAQMRMDADTKKASRKLAQEIVGAGGLTAGLADTLIERVYVYPGNQLDVEWKIKDFCKAEIKA